MKPSAHRRRRPRPQLRDSLHQFPLSCTSTPLTCARNLCRICPLVTLLQVPISPSHIDSQARVAILRFYLNHPSSWLHFCHQLLGPFLVLRQCNCARFHLIRVLITKMSEDTLVRITQSIPHSCMGNSCSVITITAFSATVSDAEASATAIQLHRPQAMPYYHSPAKPQVHSGVPVCRTRTNHSS